FSSLCLLRPPTSTLFPYTTLFRSQIWISKVRLEHDVVRMTVKFQNSSSATDASPEDLQLIDAGRRASNLITDATGCKTWTRHDRSEEHTSELQSRGQLVCRLLLEK